MQKTRAESTSNSATLQLEDPSLRVANLFGSGMCLFLRKTERRCLLLIFFVQRFMKFGQYR